MTDSAGRFEFNRAPPLDVKIFHAPRAGRGIAGMMPVTQITNLTLHAGETRTVTLGGQGRPVTGRVQVKNYTKSVDWQDQIFWMDRVAAQPPDYPDLNPITEEYHDARKAATSQQERDMAQARYAEQLGRRLGAWYSTPAGRQYWFSRRSYVLRFSQDGSFRIDDVPGGKYQLSIELRDLQSSVGQSHSPLIASRKMTVEVPDSPEGRTDAPFDLGVVNMIAQINPGELAPDFEVKSLDGKPLKLSDFKGKYVLLDFWASGNPAFETEIPNLQETYAAFKNDRRFVMVGLSLDANETAARAFCASNHLDWPQGCVGAGPATNVPEQYGVDTVPLILLIDRYGRVTDNGLHGAWIKMAVEASLSDQDP